MFLIHLLRRNNFFALGCCFFLLVLLWASHLFIGSDADIVAAQQPIVAQSLWLHWLPNAWWSIWGAFLLTFVAAWALLVLNNRHLFHGANEFLLPLLYVLLASVIPSTQWFSGVQVAVLLIFIGLNYLFHSHHKSPGLAELFIAVFCFSIAALCFPPALLLLLLPPIATLVLRSFSWRDWVILFIAATLPFIYLFLYYWLPTHDTATAFNAFHVLLPALPREITFNDSPIIIFLASIVLVLFIAIAGSYTKQTGTKAKLTHIRTIFLWMLLFLFAGFIFYPAYNYQIMPLLALPVSVIVANYLALPKGRKMKIFCGLLLLIAIIYLQLADFL